MNHTGNNLDPATEAIESSVPVVLLRKEYVTDSGGPGQHRGGAAVLRDALWLAPAEHNVTSLHAKTPAGTGVHGGGSGTAQACWMLPGMPAGNLADRAVSILGNAADIYAQCVPVAGMIDPGTGQLDPAGHYYYFGSRPVWEPGFGGVLRFRTGGGGGWGDPLDRDPERVLHDVRDEYVSIAGAWRDYGVAIAGDPVRHPEALTIDHAATARQRADLRAARAAAPAGPEAPPWKP